MTFYRIFNFFYCQTGVARRGWAMPSFWLLDWLINWLTEWQRERENFIRHQHNTMHTTEDTKTKWQAARTGISPTSWPPCTIRRILLFSIINLLMLFLDVLPHTSIPYNNCEWINANIELNTRVNTGVDIGFNTGLNPFYQNKILNDTSEIFRGRSALIGQINNVLCFFRSLNHITKMQLLISYCYSLHGCVLWDIAHSDIELVCSAWRSGVWRVWGLPNFTHRTFIPLINRRPPLYDETIKG